MSTEQQRGGAMNMEAGVVGGAPSLASELAKRLRAGRGPRNMMVSLEDDTAFDMGPAQGIPVVIYLPRIWHVGDGGQEW